MSEQELRAGIPNPDQAGLHAEPSGAPLAGLPGRGPGLTAAAPVGRLEELTDETAGTGSLNSADAAELGNGLGRPADDGPQPLDGPIRTPLSGQPEIRQQGSADGPEKGAQADTDDWPPQADEAASLERARALVGEATRQLVGEKAARLVSQAAEDLANCLEGYVAEGGDLPALERALTEVGVNMLLEADAEYYAAMGSATNLDEHERQFLLGTRDAVELLLSPVDLVGSLAREPMNLINYLCGGDPQYFKPLGPALADAAGLPRPRNSTEQAWSYARQALGSLPMFIALGSGLLAAGKTAASDGLSHAFGRLLTEKPLAQASATAGGTLAGAVVQYNGGGPLSTLAASLIGGTLGGATLTSGLSRSGKGTSIYKTATGAAEPGSTAGPLRPGTDGPVIGGKPVAVEGGTDLTGKVPNHWNTEKKNPSPLNPKGQPITDFELPGAPTFEDILNNPRFKVPIEGQTASTRDILSFVRDTVEKPQHTKPRLLGFQQVTPDAAKRIKAQTGLELDGYEHTLDEFGIRHSIKGHYGILDTKGKNKTTIKKKKRMGTIPMTLEDYARLPQLTSEFDNVRLTGYHRSKPVLEFQKTFPDGTQCIAEAIKKNDGQLVTVSFWKEVPLAGVLAGSSNATH